MLRWFARVTALLAVLLVMLVVGVGLLPPEADPVVAPDAYGAGAVSVVPAYSGLLRDFPPINGPAPEPDQVELGHLLFYDPILSQHDDIACATCHHPDLGFADGRATAMGAGAHGFGPARQGGLALQRNSPTLWNVAYNRFLFWDGRAAALETQLMTPLAHSDEMGADPDALVRDLRGIPAYVEHFERAFGVEGAEAVTLDRVAKALAAFERTLISNRSPFDRYAEGDARALTPAQRRGLILFRSAATRCFECHQAPTFASDTFRVIGTPSNGTAPDPGRAIVARDAAPGAFKVPTLRNIALTAPYMHNGSLETLEEVIDFYAAGGGRQRGIEGVDPFVLGFDLSDQERSDLVAFLYALTDESRLPEVPTEVPSGLPIVERMENPIRELVAAANVPPPAVAQSEAGHPATIRVQPGETIQSAVDRAGPGTVIEVPPGTYHERVAVDVSGITLRGIPDHNGNYPLLDGEGVLADGVIASGNDFTIERLAFRNYTGNGVLVEGVRNVIFRDLKIADTGIYGVYPVQSTGVLIERVEVSGVKDAGIYAGQCQDVVIRENVVYGNVIGIETENVVNAEVINNHAYDNSVGIFVTLLPQLTSQVSLRNRVANNLIEDNNLDNFATEGMLAALLPRGTGVLLLAADEAEVTGNTIRNHGTTGIAVYDLGISFKPEEIDVGSRPEHNRIWGNTLSNNGYDPAPAVRELGIPGADLLWDGSGWSNLWDQPGASSFPPLLPSSQWPDVARRSYSRLFRTVVESIP